MRAPRTAAAALAVATMLAGCGGGGRRSAPGVRAAPGARAAIVLAPVQAPRTPPPGLLGFNGEALAAPGVWTAPRFVATVAALRPQAIRVFGGTTANYWDWRAGTFTTSAPAAYRALRGSVRVRLRDWARLVRVSGAVPIFDLNLVTSTLPQQLAMLRAARRLGMVVTRVELGNELYDPRYAARFASGAAYGREASRWAAAIKAAFPGVAVAASAYGGADTNGGFDPVPARERGWNAGLLRTLHGVDALALHTYFGSGLAPRARSVSATATARVLASAGRRWMAARALIDALPLPVWVTEWNLFDRRAAVHGTWAQALAVAAYGLALLSDPHVAQADNHALVSSAPFAAIFVDRAGLALGAGSGFTAAGHAPTTPLGLSANGLAMQALLHTLAGARTLTVLGGGPLAGLAAGARGLLLNPTARAVTVQLPPALRGLSYLRQSARPGRLVTGAGAVSTTRGRTGSESTLPPFSLSTIGAYP